MSYNSDSLGVWVLDLCFKVRRFETHIEEDANVCQMIAALPWLALSSYHSSLVSHLREKDLCRWHMDPTSQGLVWLLQVRTTALC